MHQLEITATPPALTRRGLLRGSATLGALGFASASVVSADAALPAIAASTSVVAGSAQPESAELLAIGAEIEPAVKRFEDAEAALEEARERALAAAVPIPKGLPVPFGISIFGQIDWYSLPEPANILGQPVELPRFVSPKTGKVFRVRVPRSFDILADRRKSGRLTGTPAWARGEHRRLYDLAMQFERATDDARETSGLNDAEIEHLLAAGEIVGLCRQARSLQARTVAGIIVKAQAIDACSAIDSDQARSEVERASRDLPFAICDVVRAQASRLAVS